MVVKNLLMRREGFSKIWRTLGVFLFNKSLRFPFAWPPSPYKDDAADVLVEGKAYPHAYKTIAEGNADDIAQANGNSPLEDDADDEGIDGVARGA